MNRFWAVVASLPLLPCAAEAADKGPSTIEKVRLASEQRGETTTTADRGVPATQTTAPATNPSAPALLVRDEAPAAVKAFFADNDARKRAAVERLEVRARNYQGYPDVQQRIRAEAAEVNAAAVFVPTLSEFRVGDVGNVLLDQVVKIVDGQNAIFRVRGMYKAGQWTADTTDVWISGMRTAGLAVGERFDQVETLFFAGQRSYATVGEPDRTVLRAVRFVADDYLEAPRRGAATRPAEGPADARD